MTARKKTTPEVQASKPSDLTGADAVQYAFMGATGLSPQELPYGLHSGWFEEYKRELAKYGITIRNVKAVTGKSVVLWRGSGKLLAAHVDILIHGRKVRTQIEVDNGTGHKVPKAGLIQIIEVEKKATEADQTEVEQPDQVDETPKEDNSDGEQQ